MFVELATLLQGNLSSVSVTATREADGRLTVVVLPRVKPASGLGDTEVSQLSTPLRMTGTPEELDGGFFTAISTYGQARNSLEEQLKATVEILNSAKKESVAKSAKALTQGAKVPTPAATAVATATTPASAAPPAPAPAQADEGLDLNLFGDN